MSSIIRATTTSGLQIAPDNSGSLILQTNGTTAAVTVDTSQNATFAGKVTSAGALTLASNGTTTALTIDTSQNVGIGTTSPTNRLQLSSTGNPGLILEGTNQGSNLKKIRLASQLIAAGDFAIQSMNDNDTVKSTNLYIDSSGRWMVNATTPLNSGSARGSMKFDGAVEQGMFIATSGATGGQCMGFNYNTTTNVGSINITASATSYATSSDYRLKENIVPMIGALDKVSLLKPVTYKWKADGSDGQGFIAHELAEVVPDCVSGEKDAVDEDGNIKPQQIDTSFLVATLTAAIQEQQTIINDLKARIETLEAK